MDPYPHSICGSGSRRVNLSTKNRKKQGNCTKIKDESVISILFVYSRTKPYWYRTFLTRSELSIRYIFFIRIRNTALISSVFAYRYSRTKPYICSQIRAVDSFYLIKSPNHSVLLGSNMYR